MYQAEEFVEGGYDASAYQPQFDAQFDQPTYQYVFGGAAETEETRTTQTRLNVPDVIRNFLVYFEKQVAEKNVMEIQNVYELSFNKLSERFYKNAPWPEVDHIEQIVGHDGEFLILYKELYFRHIYAKQQHLSGMPTLEQRFESYYNYCDIFNYILSAEEPVELELPNQWLWDIIDEFIYQFQSFCQYRCKLKNKSEDEIQVLRSNPMVWNVHSVLNVLHSLVEKSHINEQLQAEEAGEDPEEVAGDFGLRPLYKMLGYFSLVGLLRLHSLLGDYHEAIHTLRHVQMNRKTLSAVVPGCQVTTYYYVGFAYLMMRRYQEAIQTFCNILLYVQRTKQLLQMKSVQFETTSKQSDQMYALLAITLGLCPQRIDESVHSQLKEKIGERVEQLAKGDEKLFDEMFSYACPKFLSPVPPNYDGPRANLNKEPYQLQVKLFMTEVQQQKPIADIRSYLKLYTTLPLPKLAALMEKSEDDVRSKLMCFKHKLKSCQAAAAERDPLATDVDFYVDGDMIHIADTKVTRHYGDFFVRHIHKYQEMSEQFLAAASQLRKP